MHLCSVLFTTNWVVLQNMQALLGTDQELVRWRTCVTFVNQNMGVAVGRMYVERYFGKDARENVSSVYTVSQKMAPTY